MPNDTLAVELIAVSKSYGYVQALKSVSLSIKAGEFSALSGHNGAGKTTLLKIIATHITPSSGSVKLFGNDAFNDGAGEIRNRIGFVTHASFLYDELTIKENLLFYAKLFSVKGEEDFTETIEFLGLKRWYNVPVKHLSHGLRKRADIVRALLHNPDLILLDEPFSGLDTTTCDLLVGYFKGRHEENGKTLILSSHSIEWAKRICDKRITLAKGKLVEESSFHNRDEE